MDLQIAHKVQRNKQGKIRYRRFRKGGYDHYRVRLYLKGEDVSKVAYVEYELHPTFSNRNRTVDNSDENYSLYIWTWGEFDVAATVYLNTGENVTYIHLLEYSNELPVNEGEYVDETPNKYLEA